MSSSPIHLPQADLSIYTIPKNGGTTLWAWMYFLRASGNLPPYGKVYDAAWLAHGPALRQSLVVRRDPIDRFISGYRNFRDHRGLTLGFDDFFESFPNLYRTNENIRHHFRPQSSYYQNLALEKVDYVMNFNNFADIKILLEQLSKRKLPQLQLQQAIFSDFEVADWQAEVIAEFYECDYKAGFGVPDAWRTSLIEGSRDLAPEFF